MGGSSRRLRLTGRSERRSAQFNFLFHCELSFSRGSDGCSIQRKIRHFVPESDTHSVDHERPNTSDCRSKCSEAIIVREAYVWRPRLVLLRNLRGPRILEAILDTLVGFLKTTTADVENDRRRVTQGVPQRRTKACDHEGCLVEHDLLDSASNSESSGLVVRCSLAEVAERDVQFRIGLESRNRHPHRVSCTRDKRNHRSRVFLLDGPILVRCRYQGLWLNGAPGCLYGCDFAACGHDGF